MPTDAERFDSMCTAVAQWPRTVGDEETDLLLCAAHEAFCPDGAICKALRILYLRNGMLRMAVDVTFGSMTDHVRRRP